MVMLGLRRIYGGELQRWNVTIYQYVKRVNWQGVRDEHSSGFYAPSSRCRLPAANPAITIAAKMLPREKAGAGHEGPDTILDLRRAMTWTWVKDKDVRS